MYRAQGYDWVSRLGYAVSSNALSVEERAPDPVYECKPIHDQQSLPLPAGVANMSSGGRHLGCEDPRITAIDGMIYMLFVAFDGFSIPRLAITSIRQDDFLARKWQWSPARIISKPGVIDKSGALLSEKIDGKYVLFHRVFPDILIDFVDSLSFPGGAYLEGAFKISVRPGKWDSRKIGTGPPPIKTKYGWLLIYYAVDERDEHKYKIGVMLLDLNDPRRVLHRCSKPVLEPTARYENDGHKAGVAYPCGAAVIGSRLFVYYGGADSVVCAAAANLNRLLINLLREPAE